MNETGEKTLADRLADAVATIDEAGAALDHKGESLHIATLRLQQIRDAIADAYAGRRSIGSAFGIITATMNTRQVYELLEELR